MEKLKKFVESTAFQTVILGVIILNSVLLGLQTVPALNDICGDAFSIADSVCLGIFIVEMILKLIVYRLGYFKDGWNWFDFLIILTSLVSDLAVLSAFRVFRVFRVFRSLKALRSMKMVSTLKHLRVIILAIGRSVPSIAWTGLLLLLIYYIFSIIGVSMFGTAFPEWFGDIGKSMYTLFQVMTLESWSMGISRPVMEVFPYAWLYFVPFVLISAFIVMNVVVGIVVNSISEVTAIQKKEETGDASSNAPDALENGEKIHLEIAEVREHLAALERLLDEEGKIKQ